MTNEQEIERMATVAAKGLITKASTNCIDCENFGICAGSDIPLDCKVVIGSRNLVNAGIGDKKQAVKEFVQRLEVLSFSIGTEDYVHTTTIDELFTELYGADEK